MYAGGIKFDGSELFEEISNISKDGKMIISSNKKTGVQKLWLINQSTSVVETFDDIHGKLSFGNKSFTFDGSACNSMFNFSYRKTYNENDTKITFGLNFKKWEGCDLRHLPYHSKLLSLFEKLANGWELFSTLEIEGKKILDSNGIDISKLEFVNQTRSVLHYIDKVATISRYLGEPISFTSNFSYTAEEFERVIEIAKIISGQCIYMKKDLTSNASCTLIVNECAKNIELIKSMTEPTIIKIVEKDKEPIMCFGKTLMLPEKAHLLIRVMPKIIQPKNEYREGELVKLEWIPSNGFECRVEYVKP